MALTSPVVLRCDHQPEPGINATVARKEKTQTKTHTKKPDGKRSSTAPSTQSQKGTQKSPKRRENTNKNAHKKPDGKKNTNKNAHKKPDGKKEQRGAQHPEPEILECRGGSLGFHDLMCLARCFFTGTVEQLLWHAEVQLVTSATPSERSVPVHIELPESPRNRTQRLQERAAS